MVAAIPQTPMNSRMRGSVFFMSAPTMGDMMMANIPTGATAKPAQVAV